MPIQTAIDRLNAPTMDERLSALRTLKTALENGELKKPAAGIDVNNHIHTTFSFSPYSPSKAVYTAYMNGLQTAGIMDHDSLSGAKEFIEAGKIIGLATTIGIEVRADFSKTPFGNVRLNNPDQPGCGYITVHGIPHSQIDAVVEYTSPLRALRGKRNRLMTENINALMTPHGITLDYDTDVLPLSQAQNGGSVTERHLMFALAQKLIQKFGKNGAVVSFLRSIGVDVPAKLESLLTDSTNPFYEYDLLGVLKGDFIGKIYIPATDELPQVSELIAFMKARGAIVCYSYLGDVGDSVTGDKKAQTLEDPYLDELIKYCSETLGFIGLGYMPTRNTMPQLDRVRALAEHYGFIQISGEDINQPRQQFICSALREPKFQNLIDTTWALIGHEQAATKNLEDAFFFPKAVAACPDLYERIEKYKQLGLSFAKNQL